MMQAGRSDWIARRAPTPPDAGYRNPRSLLVSTSFISSPHFLRTVLRFDALSCLACGLPQVILPEPMARLFGLPEALLA